MAKWTPGDIPDQTGRVVLVTGGNTGIGYITCRASTFQMGLMNPSQAMVLGTTCERSQSLPRRTPVAEVRERHRKAQERDWKG
jgi:hypothetical protein